MPRGHAMECRITAEDPERNFMPSPGLIEGLRIPSGPGIRDDSAVAPGYEIPIHYDPMVAKLIAVGRTREETIRRMRRALDEYRLDGIVTNIPFLRRLMDHPDFVAGDMHTGFLDEQGKDLVSGSDPWLDEIALIAAAIDAYKSKVRLAASGPRESGEGGSGWKRLGRWRQLGGMR